MESRVKVHRTHRVVDKYVQTIIMNMNISYCAFFLIFFFFHSSIHYLSLIPFWFLFYDINRPKVRGRVRGRGRLSSLLNKCSNSMLYTTSQPSGTVSQMNLTRTGTYVHLQTVLKWCPIALLFILSSPFLPYLFPSCFSFAFSRPIPSSSLLSSPCRPFFPSSFTSDSGRIIDLSSIIFIFKPVNFNFLELWQ